jgi:transposase
VFKMSRKRSRRRFAKEFKAETVKLVKRSDRRMSDIARELGISSKSVGEWVRNAADTKGSIGEDERADLKRLHKENSELRMEWEILRKATLGSTGSESASGTAAWAGRQAGGRFALAISLGS